MNELPKDMTAPEICAAFRGFPDAVRPGLIALRRLILDTADEIGAPIEEALRWGQPAYLTPKGSTLRLGLPKTGGYALFVICTTRLIEDFRAVTGAAFRFEANRAVLFRPGDSVDEVALSLLIRAALTYKDQSRSGARFSAR